MNHTEINFDDIFDPNITLFSSDVLKCLLDRLFDSPQKQMNFVHIAGTNGKGSTATMISSILIKAGYKTGLFTSPSVKAFVERIKTDNIPIDLYEYSKYRNYIIEKSPDMLKNEFSILGQIGEFSIATMVALEYFKKCKCDISVIEAGLGGYKDSTNLIENPLVSVITSVSLDHMKTLGNTVEEIAFQKSGIIKTGCPVVVSAGQKNSVYDIIRNAAQKKSSEFIIADPSNIELISSDIENGTKFKYKNLELSINLLGDHQLENASTALTAVEILRRHMDIPDIAIKEGMKSSFINARLEILSRAPLVILDGAHNESGFISLASFIKKYLPEKKLIGIIGMCQDKNSSNAFFEILPLFSEIIPVEIPNLKRSMPLNEISESVKLYNKQVHPFHDLEQAVSYALNKCDNNSAIVIFGSLYLARRILRNENIKF